jgi:ribonuclease III
MRFLKNLFTRRSKDGYFFLRIKEITGFKPKDPLLYQLAFRHSSASLRNGKASINNQRLEFLGDAVLGMLIAELLYTKYPDRDEGFLTQTRSKLVSRKMLNTLAKELALHQLIISRLGKKSASEQLFGNTLEALIGAVFLDHGITKTKMMVQAIYGERLSNPAELEATVVSYKSLLYELIQKQKLQIAYEVLETTGTAHNATFTMGLSIDGVQIATGKGSSKKIAIEHASRHAFKQLQKAYEQTDSV